MKKILFVLAALLVFSSVAGAANLVNWTGTLDPIGPSFPAGDISVVVNATEAAGIWDWTYTLTPELGAKDISIFSLDLTAAQNASIIAGSQTNNVGWTFTAYNTSNIKWISTGGAADLVSTTIPNSGYTSGTFKFQSTWGPSTMSLGFGQDHGQYAGMLPTPVVPEASSIMLGIMGMSSIAGLVKLRRN